MVGNTIDEGGFGAVNERRKTREATESRKEDDLAGPDYLGGAAFADGGGEAVYDAGCGAEAIADTNTQ